MNREAYLPAQLSREQFLAKLKEFRLSQGEFAAMTGYKVAAVYKWGRDRRVEPNAGPVPLWVSFVFRLIDHNRAMRRVIETQTAAASHSLGT